MQFCTECQSVMTKITTPSTDITFQCRCTHTVVGGPDDTLMAQKVLRAEESNLMHQVFIDNSPFDPAAHIVNQDCPQCGLNYMTMVMIGERATTIYTCTCGYQATHQQIKNAVNRTK
jgi:DNA-directed RNA polymerase subunit M/transcription elongation factor TFIIS